MIPTTTNTVTPADGKTVKVVMGCVVVLIIIISISYFSGHSGNDNITAPAPAAVELQTLNVLSAAIMLKQKAVNLGLRLNSLFTAAPAARPQTGHLSETFYLSGKKFERGSIVPYRTYLPPGAEQQSGLAVYVMLEASPEILPAMDDFIAEKIMPPGLFLLVNPGQLPASRPDGFPRGMRAEEFDQNGREFADFLVEELIPDAASRTGAQLSDSPDMHFITGGSSGGNCAWNAVWYRNDYFRLTFLSSPTFSAMRGGEEPMVLLRKTESRPIRIYLTVGTLEPDYYFGSSFYAACNAAKAFKFAGYRCHFELVKDGGHCALREDRDMLRRVMTFLWQDWQTEPVTVESRQIRIKNILSENSQWSDFNGDWPSHSEVRTESGVYSCDGGRILLRRPNAESPEVVADGFGHLAALALSSDRWRLYAADTTRRFVYALSIKPNGELDEIYKLAPLHLAHDCREIGALDLCVAADDRVYAATELGIQGIVSFGLTDLILPLPNDLPADRVALEIDGDRQSWLYAASGDKKFRRPVKIGPAKADQTTPPSSPEYGDDFDYSIPHLPQ